MKRETEFHFFDPDAISRGNLGGTLLLSTLIASKLTLLFFTLRSVIHYIATKFIFSLSLLYTYTLTPAASFRCRCVQ